MILVLPLAVALLVGLVCGGDLRRLARLSLRRIEFFYVAVALQLLAFPLAFMPWHTSDSVGRALWLVSYAILCCAAVVNARIPGVPVIAVGMVSNIVAVVANGGHMPALPSALRAAHEHYVVSNNSALLAAPRLPWLVDRWAVPRGLHLGNVFSVGDVVIGVGVLVLVLAAMGVRLAVPVPRRRAAGSNV